MKFYKTEVLKILAIAVLSAVLFNSLSATGIGFIYKPVQFKHKKMVSLEETKKIFDEKSALFIDARPAVNYKHGHIPGAINVPFNSKDKEKLMADISKDQSIIVYCYSERCNQARLLHASITKLGYTNSALFAGGIMEWTKAKYPVEKSEEKSAEESAEPAKTAKK